MYRQPFRKSLSVGLATVLSLVACNWPVETLANTANTVEIPDVGLPGRREGAATRSGCYGSETKFLHALTPKSNLGKTLAAYPTIFVYVPPNNAEEAEFILSDRSEQEIYKSRIQLNGEPGIVKISLPPTPATPQLEIGKNYKWSFQLLCGSGDQVEAGDYVEGWVQRQQPSAEIDQALKAASERDRVAIYAKAGYWYEVLSTLAELRRDRPNDRSLMTDWKSILTSVGLEKLTEEPIVSCCANVNASDRAQP